MKVGSLGFAGSGKTTYLGALTLSLLQGDTTSDLVLFSFESVETARDLTQFADRIQKGSWPARTDSSKVAEYALRLRRGELVFSLRIPELPGELLEEVWRTDHIPASLAFLASYDAWLVLVDPLVQDPERAAAHHVHLLQGLKRARGWKRSEMASEPLGVVLTKWDALDPEDQARGPEAWLQETFPLLDVFLRSNFTRRAAFAASAVGAVDAAGTPLLQAERIRPRGVFRPLEWVADQLQLARGGPAPARR